MTLPSVHDEWEDEVDESRLLAQPRCISAAWILAALIVVMAVVGPAAAELIDHALLTVR